MKTESLVKRSELEKSRVPVRLQKLLSSAGVASRRACESLIKEGRVEVNGVQIKELGSKAIPDIDTVSVDGVPISLPQKVIIVLNKPRGVVTTMNDPEGRPCVGDYVKTLPMRVYPVGRLDFDVSGLLVLTNDGDFANRLMHPSNGFKRKYIARIKGSLNEKRINLLTKGIHLPDGLAVVTSVRAIHSNKDTRMLLGDPKPDESLIELVVVEGRTHFVKRVLEVVGTPVRKLSRIEFGPFTLQGIPSGRMRQVALREELYG